MVGFQSRLPLSLSLCVSWYLSLCLSLSLCVSWYFGASIAAGLCPVGVIRAQCEPTLRLIGQHQQPKTQGTSENIQDANNIIDDILESGLTLDLI